MPIWSTVTTIVSFLSLFLQTTFAANWLDAFSIEKNENATNKTKGRCTLFTNYQPDYRTNANAETYSMFFFSTTKFLFLFCLKARIAKSNIFILNIIVWIAPLSQPTPQPTTAPPTAAPITFVPVSERLLINFQVLKLNVYVVFQDTFPYAISSKPCLNNCTLILTIFFIL